ncbi:MAG: hypothetical protein M1816_003980 [Peltula sp. TS41687]|nr:MAG: hypothetical protein M1816_003980 [Peltula sp. TS41687]
MSDASTGVGHVSTSAPKADEAQHTLFVSVEENMANTDDGSKKAMKSGSVEHVTDEKSQAPTTMTFITSSGRPRGRSPGASDMILQTAKRTISNVIESSSSDADAPLLIEENGSLEQALPKLRNVFRAITRGAGLNEHLRTTFLGLDKTISRIWMSFRLYATTHHLDDEDVREIQKCARDVVLRYGHIKHQIQVGANKWEDVKKDLAILERYGNLADPPAAIKIWNVKLEDIDMIFEAEVQLFKVFLDLFDAMIFVPFQGLMHVAPMPREWDLPAHLFLMHDAITDVVILAEAYHKELKDLEKKVVAAIEHVDDNPDIKVDEPLGRAMAGLEAWVNQQARRDPAAREWVCKDITFMGIPLR